MLTAGGSFTLAATWLGFLLSLMVRGAPGGYQEQQWNLLAEKGLRLGLAVQPLSVKIRDPGWWGKGRKSGREAW